MVPMYVMHGCMHACIGYIHAYILTYIHTYILYIHTYRDIFIRGARGALPPLNFDNPKRSNILYVMCGTIIRRVVAAARCKSSVIDFWIFFKYCLDVL